MTEEFNLSEKIYISDSDEAVHIVDVQIAVGKLKKYLKDNFPHKKLGIYNLTMKRIDKIFGEKLT